MKESNDFRRIMPVLAGMAAIFLLFVGPVTAGDGSGLVCSVNQDCETGSFCWSEPGECGTVGKCRPMPELCPDVYDPVCGCDGQNYASDCVAAIAGVSVASEGECTTVESCIDDSDCDADDFCQSVPGRCGSEGTCHEVPQVCALIWATQPRSQYQRIGR